MCVCVCVSGGTLLGSKKHGCTDVAEGEGNHTLPMKQQLLPPKQKSSLRRVDSTGGVRADFMFVYLVVYVTALSIFTTTDGFVIVFFKPTCVCVEI